MESLGNLDLDREYDDILNNLENLKKEANKQIKDFQTSRKELSDKKRKFYKHLINDASSDETALIVKIKKTPPHAWGKVSIKYRAVLYKDDNIVLYRDYKKYTVEEYSAISMSFLSVKSKIYNMLLCSDPVARGMARTYIQEKFKQL